MARPDFVIVDGGGDFGGSTTTISFVISPSLYTITAPFYESTSVSIASLFNNNNITAKVVTKTNSVVTSEVVISANELTFSKQYLYKEDAFYSRGSNRIRINVSYQNYSSYFDVVLDYVKPVSIEVEAVDNKIYVLDDSGINWDFDKDTDITINRINVRYNNGGVSETIGKNSIDSQYLRYFLYEDSTREIQNDLPQQENLTIYIEYTVGNIYFAGETYTLRAPHVLPTAESELHDFHIDTTLISVPKGHRQSFLKDVCTLKAYDSNDNEVTISKSLWSIAHPYSFIFEPFNTLDVVYGETIEDVPLNKTVPVVSAEVDSAHPPVFNPTLKTTYEADEAINLTQTTILVRYTWTDYRSTLTFSDATDYFDVALIDENDDVVIDDPSAFDGSTKIEDLGLQSLTGLRFRFRLHSAVLDTPYTCDEKPALTYIEIKSIDSIQINNPYRDYEVGDRFLKQEDTTTATITYKDANDITKTKTILLNSGFSKLIIEPSRDEMFLHVNPNQQVVVKSVFDSSKTANYYIVVSPKTINDDFEEITCRVEYWDNVDLPNGENYSPKDGNGLLVIYDENNEIIGWIENINNPNAQAKVVLLNDYVPDIDNTSNIEVQFPYYVEGQADEINKCHFGCLFGANNAMNRLFLSGNPKIPNADWHSAEPNYTDYYAPIVKTNGNFSYFSDESIMYYGETDNEVVGYEVISNDKLLVLKNKSDKEKTVYFRNPTIVRAIDAAGNEMTGYDGEELYQEEFSLTKGNNSVAGISPKTICNFNGQTLFLDSNNQLVGLDVEGIVGDNQRYANTRSKYVDKVLSALDLTNAIVWTNNTYLFIAVKGYGVLATHFRAFDSDARQYEWFYLTSDDPVAFLEKDNEIYFANDKGDLYKYNKDSFVDVKKIFSDYTLKYSNDGKLIVDREVVEEIEQKQDEEFTFKSLTPQDADYKQKVFYKVALLNSDATDENANIYIDNTNNWLEVKDNTILLENTDYYLDGYIEADISSSQTNLHNCIGKKFRVKQTSVDGLEHGDRFHLYKVENNEETQVDIVAFFNARLCCCIEDEEVEVSYYHKKESSSSSEFNTITLSKDGNVIELVRYGDQLDEHLFKSEIRNRKNVEAFYITAPFILGSLDYFKTIWSYTLTNDSGIPSEIEISYASNKIPLVDIKKMSYISLTKEAIGISLNDLNYHKVDFDKLVVPRTYTFNRVLARQKFICFAFRNYNDTNAVLSAMSITYSLPFPSYSGD